ncbi:MAG: tRNA preQ1(34) S-adenosylmethionine ribosyltransferase-isomerase QueA [Clostridia bacterium]|nr:tRNA preQ1(34) S-adenosylmethionine ribosyltransferase-isomerase QueA [Clostridia bacterium]
MTLNTDLKVSDFFYDLPPELIAQTPLEPRDSSRLLLLDKNTGKIEHKIFRDVIDYLDPGDVLVINNSRVIPARVYGKRAGGGALEILLLKCRELDTWEVLTRPGRKMKPGTTVSLGDGQLTATVLDIVEDGNRIVRFDYDRDKYRNIYSVLHEIGTMPLPPYITEKLENQERYQTVYSKTEGSAAAPTAGLHFTEELLCRIRDKGIAIAEVTLNVGLGTFRPVKAENITDHIMHSEYYEITREAAELINSRKRAGGRIIAVGTTSCRVLESASLDDGTLTERSGDTDIFIYPGYRFKALDALITNFHLPESTLLMLVSALAGKDNIFSAYKTAVDEKYRFFSFGDAMFIK